MADQENDPNKPDTTNDAALAAAAQAEEAQRAVNEAQENQNERPNAPLLQQEDIQAARNKYGAERMQKLAENVANIEKLENAVDDENLDKIICCIGVMLGIVLVFFIIIIITLCIAKSNSEGCGIPVYDYLIIYFSLLPIFLIILLFLWCLCRVCNQLKILGALMILLLVYQIAVAAYIIYGYFTYFSKANDCQSQPDTSIALVFMCIILILGLGQIVFALMLLCVVPMAYIALQVLVQQMEEEKREFNGLRDGFKWTIANFRVGNAEREKLEDKCIICYEDFKEDDGKEVSKLPCGHLFHCECIISWIDANHIDCPICKKPIPHAKEVQDQLKAAGGNNEGGEPEQAASAENDQNDPNEDDELMSTVRKTAGVRKRLIATQARRANVE